MLENSFNFALYFLIFSNKIFNRTILTRVAWMNLKAQCSYAGLSVLKITDERVAGVRDFRKGTSTAHDG